MAVRDEYTAEVVEDLETLQDLYDYRVYDLRNTTLDAILNNEDQNANFRTVSIHDVLFNYDGEEEPEPVVAITSELPVPTIESLDNNGVLTIKFDKKLRVPERYKTIEEAEVALRFM